MTTRLGKRSGTWGSSNSDMSAEAVASKSPLCFRSTSNACGVRDKKQEEETKHTPLIVFALAWIPMATRA